MRIETKMTRKHKHKRGDLDMFLGLGTAGEHRQLDQRNYSTTEENKLWHSLTFRSTNLKSTALTATNLRISTHSGSLRSRKHGHFHLMQSLRTWITVSWRR